MKNLMIKCFVLSSLIASSVFAGSTIPVPESNAKIIKISNPSQRVGIRIGDVLARNIELELKQPLQIAKDAFPVKGTNINGMELANVQVKTVKRDDKTVYKINLNYQVFSQPDKPAVMRLPAEKIAIVGGSAGLTANIPEWSFWFSPLVPNGMTNAKQNLRPQYKPTLIDLQTHFFSLAIFLGFMLVGLVGLVYINADKQWLPWMNGAFAQAHRNLKKLARTMSKNRTNHAALHPASEKKALIYMHQAFNKVYGANLFANELDTFIQTSPAYSTLKAEINTFFERSNATLFGEQNHNSEQFINDLIVLSKNLRNCERGVQ